MGAAPRKTKQRSPKSLQTTSLGYSIAKSALKVQLTFSKVEKTKVKNVNFVHLVLYICVHVSFCAPLFNFLTHLLLIIEILVTL